MKSEITLLAGLALALLVLEVGARAFESSLSADVRQMLAQDEIPGQIRESKREGRASILVIGNSLARAGIVPEEIAGALRSGEGEDADVFYITPDASGINEWTAAYRRGFPDAPETARPDFVIIVTGPGHLSDHPVTSPEKLSAYHVAREDRWEVLTNWLPTFGERCRFVLSGMSRLFANRERVRPLLFYRLVPGYAVTAQRLNESGSAREAPPLQRKGGVERFEMLLDSLGVPAERVLVVAVPLPWKYELPGSVLATARSRNVIVDSEEASSAWAPEAFPDGYHLSPEFGRVLTRQLGERIRTQVRSDD